LAAFASASPQFSYYTGNGLTYSSQLHYAGAPAVTYAAAPAVHHAAPAVTYAAAPAVHHAAPAVTYAAAPAVTYAAAPAVIAPTVTKSQYHSQDEQGRAAFGHNEPRQFHNAVRDAAGNVQGAYGYIDPNGKDVRVHYTAGKQKNIS